MTLRLVLVSIVACLGLSLPSAERLGRWTRSGQSWTNGRLAEWEKGEPIDEGRFVVVADTTNIAPTAPPVSTTEVAETAPAVDPVPATSPIADAEPKAVAKTAATVEPLVAASSADDAESKAVMADWLAAIEREAAPPSVTAFDATTADLPQETVAPTIPVVAETVEPAAISAQETEWWEAWMAELSRPVIVDSASDAPGAAVAPVVAETFAPTKEASADQVFGAVVDEMVLSFSRDNEAMAAASLPETAAGTDESAPTTPAFEPMVVVEEDLKDPAYALNRAAEGLAAPVPASPTGPQVRENQLSHAVRLTRDAVNAWARLLHGPALMTLGR
ncbi:MAG: hypothetical protein P4L84_38115 [Isosphaeraceae bacterium]|nr:hypothetical protein [Isosphaeraceae bacterium]